MDAQSGPHEFRDILTLIFNNLTFQRALNYAPVNSLIIITLVF